MIYSIVCILISGHAFNFIFYSVLADYYKAYPNNKEVLKKKRILLILALVPFLLTVLTMVYAITVMPVKAFLKEWRGE